MEVRGGTSLNETKDSVLLDLAEAELRACHITDLLKRDVPGRVVSSLLALDVV